MDSVGVFLAPGSFEKHDHDLVNCVSLVRARHITCPSMLGMGARPSTWDTLSSQRYHFSPRRRTAKPLALRLRSPRPIPGHSTVPGGEGLATARHGPAGLRHRRCLDDAIWLTPSERVRLERAKGHGETFKERFRFSNRRGVKRYSYVETIVISKGTYIHRTTQARTERITLFDDRVGNASLAPQARKCGGGEVDGVGLRMHCRYE